MIITLLDNTFNSIKLVEEFKSFIWTDRWNKFGDFELVVPITSANLNDFKDGYFLTLDESEHVMIIEAVEVITNVKEGNSLNIKGRSIESILFRRIVWFQTILDGNLQTELQRLLHENVYLTGYPSRNIPNFSFVSSVDPAVTALTVQGQYTGDYIYDVISDICIAKGLGFKITVPTTGSLSFAFELYMGEDRSYSQSVNPYVVFSPTFDNLLSSDYFSSNVNLRTIALVAGEGEGTDRLTDAVDLTSGTGLARREIFVDARDLSKTTDSGTLTDVEYIELLDQRAREVLADNISIKHFEGEVETTLLYSYGTDFFMGDIVRIEDQYGHQENSRIVEFIFSQNPSGINKYPTFQVVE